MTPPSRHSIQTQGQLVVVLSIGVERHITLEYIATHFNVLGKTRPGNPSRPYTHTSERSTLRCCYGGS